MSARRNERVIRALTAEEFASRLLSTQRNHASLLSNLFCTAVLREESNQTVRLHVLCTDGSGRPQVGMLVRELAGMALDYCIPRKEIDRALADFYENGTTRRIGILQNEARKIFSDLDKSGEGGELLLFLLTEAVLKYRQAVSKMALKTSSRMHVHGLDGIYISCQGDPLRLRLHYGESKIHKKLSGAIRDGVTSLAGMLEDEGFVGQARRDFFLLNTQTDLGDPVLEEALRAFLDPADPRFMRPAICPILLAGYEAAEYPAVDASGVIPPNLLDEGEAVLPFLSDELSKRSVGSFKLDLFLVPFPSVSDFRMKLMKELG